MSERLVIVGGGQAAVQIVHSVRQHGFDGNITLVGEESHPPYQRPPLSKKYLAGDLPRERLFLRPESFYGSRGVEMLLDTRVEELEPDPRRVRLSDGRTLSYDRLALATGSRVRRTGLPGDDLDGVHYVRTIADIDAVADSFRPGAKLVIVGAGYIGLETAAVAAQKGLDVTVLEMFDRVLARVVCEEVAGFFHARHSEAGVRIVCGAQVSAFVGSNGVEAVETAAGERYACELAIVGIGVVPNVELARAAGFECDNGISVDACARTADPGVVAAGDCTNHPHPFVGRKVRLESVNNAIEQAKAAASSLAGAPQPFDDIPWFWSDQYEVKLQIAGLALDYDEVAVRGDIDAGRFAAYYLRAGRPIAIDAVNSPKDFMNGRKLLAARVKLAAGEIADTGVDLNSRIGAT